MEEGVAGSSWKSQRLGRKVKQQVLWVPVMGLFLTPRLEDGRGQAHTGREPPLCF